MYSGPALPEARTVDEAVQKPAWFAFCPSLPYIAARKQRDRR